MGKPHAPPTPDFASIAKQQGAANQATAITEFGLNNANQITPWGSKTTTQNAGSTTDNPSFTINTTLNPADQANLDSQRALESGLLALGPTALGTAANTLGSRLETGNLPPMSYQVDAGGTKNLDYGQLPGGVYDVGNTDAIRQRMEDAAWGKYISRAAPIMRPADGGSQHAARQHGRGHDELRCGIGSAWRCRRAKAIRRGRRSSTASCRAATRRSRSRGCGSPGRICGTRTRGQDAGLFAGQTAANNPTNQQDVQNAFANANLTNATRAQAINEQAQLRQMPLNELMAMLSGTQVNRRNSSQLPRPTSSPRRSSMQRRRRARRIRRRSVRNRERTTR